MTWDFFFCFLIQFQFPFEMSCSNVLVPVSLLISKHIGIDMLISLWYFMTIFLLAVPAKSHEGTRSTSENEKNFLVDFVPACEHTWIFMDVEKFFFGNWMEELMEVTGRAESNATDGRKFDGINGLVCAGFGNENKVCGCESGSRSRFERNGSSLKFLNLED